MGELVHYIDYKMLPTPTEMIRHAKQIATSLSPTKRGGHPVDYYGVFHNENLEKYKFICKICKPGKDVNLDGLKALENHLESDEHSNSIKLHLPENNQQVKEAMLDESACPGTATGTGLMMGNVKALNLAQFTPKDLILAAWKIKENLNLDFKGGHRVDYYGIVSIPSSTGGKCRYKCILCDVPIDQESDVERHLEGGNGHTQAIVSHHPDNNSEVQSALCQLEEERGRAMPSNQQNTHPTSRPPQRNAQQRQHQHTQLGMPQMGLPYPTQNPHLQKQQTKKAPVSGSGYNPALDYRNLLCDGTPDWSLQPPQQHWSYAPVCYPPSFQQQQLQALLGPRSMTKEMFEFSGEPAVNPYSTVGRGHGRGMPSMLGNVPNLL